MSSIRITRYQPELFQALASQSSLPHDSRLRQQAFVDWYYGSSDFGQLILALDEQKHCLACIGKELMTFQVGNTRAGVACLSGFYAFREGSGFYVFTAALRDCDAGLIMGGTEEGMGFARKLRWAFEEIPAYCLNIVYHENHGHPFEAVCKRALNRFGRRTPLKELGKRLPAELQGIRVAEQTHFGPELLKFDSGFKFRWAPSLEHLAWRYALSVPFVRYRLFRAFIGTRYIGYVILQDTAEGVLVAQADGTDPSLLAAAIIHCVCSVSLVDSDTREVLLLSPHLTMQGVFEAVGFSRTPRRNKFFALGSMKGPLANPVPATEWLLNFDLGDRGLVGGPSTCSKGPARLSSGTEIESTSGSIQSVREPEPVELHKFPHPYRAAFTVASDIDSASAARFRGIHNLFCTNSVLRRGTREWAALGLTNKSEFFEEEEDGIRGLGLPFADSFFLIGDATTFGMYRYRSEGAAFVEDQQEENNCAELIREALGEGQIDAFHAFLHYTRPQLEPLLRGFFGWCDREKVPKPSVWINHSAGVTPTGLCPDALQANSVHRLLRWSGRLTIGPLAGRKHLPLREAFMRYRGDTPGSPYYVNDLLARNGLKFVWLNTGDLHPNRPMLPEENWRGRRTILRPVTMDDGVRYHRFERCYGRTSRTNGQGVYLRDSQEGCDASSVINSTNLGQLCDSGGTCILYTHWTHHRSMPLSDETIGRFRLLREWQQAGKVWIAPTAQLLEWTRRRTFLDYTCSTNGNKLSIEIKGVDDPVLGYSRLDLEEADGLSFRGAQGKEVSIVAGGRLLSPNQLDRTEDCVWLKTRKSSPSAKVAVGRLAEVK